MSDKRDTQVMAAPSAAGAKKHDTITEIVRKDHRKRPSCLFPLLAIIGVMLGLVVLGTFLPPISAYSRYIDTENAFVSLGKSLEKDGLSLTAATDADAVQVRLLSASAEDYLAQADLPADWNCQRTNTLPGYLHPRDTVYSLEQRGILETNLTLGLEMPGGADLYGYDAALARWRFIPMSDGKSATLYRLPECLVITTPTPLPQLIGVSFSRTATITEDVTLAADRVYVYGLAPSRYGNLLGALPNGVNPETQRNLIPVISNQVAPNVVDTLAVESILANPELRTAHITQLIDFAASAPYLGLAIDYRDLHATSENRDRFNRFLMELGQGLRAKGQLLIVMLPVPTLDDNQWDTGAYDWQSIGQIADEVILDTSLQALSFGEGGKGSDLLTWAVTQINRYQLYLTLPTGALQAVSTEESVPVQNLSLEIDVDSTAESYAPGDTITAQAKLVGNVSFTDTSTLLTQMQWLGQFQLGGAVLIAQNDTVLRQTLAQHRADPNTQLTPEQTQLAWAILDSAGNIINVIPGNTLTYTVPTGVESVEIVAGVETNGEFVAIEARQFAVIAPTLVAVEPTAIPTLEPTESVAEETEEATLEATEEVAAPTEETQVAPTESAPETLDTATGTVVAIEPSATQATEVALQASPTNTPGLVFPTNTPIVVSTSTPVTTEATASPEATSAEITPSPEVTRLAFPTNTPLPSPTVALQPTSTFAPVNLPPAIGAVSMELAGQIEQVGDPTFNVVRSAGMGWIVIYIPYTNGDTPIPVRDQIKQLHEAGFKVLYVVVGSPFEFSQPNYVDNYINYLAALASFEADALQVWYAPNSDQYWTPEDLDPADYVALLQQSSQIVRAATTDSKVKTMVISAALAPDANNELYYQGMVAAGAAQAIDCIGVQYLNGAVPPDATTGDTRGTEFFYYLNPTVDLAFNTFGGSRPVCLTVGYLSAEGYSPLPEEFTWAETTTNALQAQWLDQAAAQSLQSGRIRLLTIWNVDFTFMGIDAAAGYALVRRDGSCPACSLLGQ